MTLRYYHAGLLNISDILPPNYVPETRTQSSICRADKSTMDARATKLFGTCMKKEKIFLDASRKARDLTGWWKCRVYESGPFCTASETTPASGNYGPLTENTRSGIFMAS